MTVKPGQIWYAPDDRLLVADFIGENSGKWLMMAERPNGTLTYDKFSKEHILEHFEYIGEV